MDIASALPPNTPEKPDPIPKIPQIENLHLENPISQRTSIPFPVTFIKNNETTALHPITTFPSPPHPPKLPDLDVLPPQRLADYTDLTLRVNVTDDVVDFILSRTLSPYNEKRQHILTEEVAALPRDDKLCLGLIHALIDVNLTNIDLLTIKMPIDPIFYLESLAHATPAHTEWLNILNSYGFKVLHPNPESRTAEQRFRNSKCTIVFITPHEFDNYENLGDLFEKLSPYGPLDYIRQQNFENPTRRQLTFVRIALEQSAIQAIKDKLFGAKFMTTPTGIANKPICTFCGIEIEKEFCNFHIRPCELMRACKFTLYPRHSIQHDICGFYFAQDMYDAHCRCCTIDNITPDRMNNEIKADLKIYHPDANPQKK